MMGKKRSRMKQDRSLQQIYDGFADTYEASRGLFDMSEVLRDLAGHLPEGKGRVLDMGCGAGEPFPRFFADRGWQVTGVDFSKRMLELAGQYVPEMKTIHGDMRDVRFDPASFDAIVSIFSLFHVPKADHPALFGRFFQWLKPGSVALFTYATKAYTGHAEFDGTIEFMGQDLFYSHTTPEKLHALLSDTGFDVIAADYRTIADETFLWVTVRKPEI